MNRCIAAAARIIATMLRSNQMMTISLIVSGIFVASTIGTVVENMMIYVTQIMAMKNLVCKSQPTQ